MTSERDPMDTWRSHAEHVLWAIDNGDLDYMAGDHRGAMGELAERVIAAKGRADQAEALLDEVALSGVAFEDPRVKYVEIQIDRSTWDEIKAWTEQT